MSDESKDSARSGGFKVSDRRHFTSRGERIEGDVEAQEGEVRPEPAAKPPREEKAGGGAADKAGRGPGEEGRLPPADFLQVIEFLFQNAAFSLGLIPDPSSGTKRLDLPHAGHFIDLLAVLQEKTKGNLSPQEESLLQDALTKLRTLYAEVSLRGGG